MRLPLWLSDLGVFLRTFSIGAQDATTDDLLTALKMTMRDFAIAVAFMAVCLALFLSLTCNAGGAQ